MILYLDTSSLAKLFIDENDSDSLRELSGNASGLVVSEVAYVEMYSLVSRRVREKNITSSESERLLRAFDRDWAIYGRIPLGDEILRVAADLTRKHPLRAFDAIHLAAALQGNSESEEPFLFLTADRQLEAAARREKLQTRI